MAEPIYFRGSRALAAQVVRQVTQSMTGDDMTHATLARGVHHAIGMAALSDIHDDFVTKARGGTGEDGVKWPPLAPATLAYGRKAPRGRGHAPGGKDGLLTKAQLRRWRQVYGTRLARFAVSMDMGSAKARAAKIAWAVVKAEGGRTKIAEYANRPHEILRDTGILLNSLSPGEVGPPGEATDSTTPNPSNPDQIFRTISGGVIVGTNVPYAGVHQYGSEKKGIPARPFLPVGEAPQIWRDRWAVVASQGIAAAIRHALANGGAT